MNFWLITGSAIVIVALVGLVRSIRRANAMIDQAPYEPTGYVEWDPEFLTAVVRAVAPVEDVDFADWEAEMSDAQD